MGDGKLLIGWASRDVTPERKVSIFGQFHVRISQGVNDPLTVTAMAMENDDASEQAVIVSLDAVWVSDALMKRCRESLARELPGFNPEKLVMGATHTHSAPTQVTAVFPDPPDLGTDVMSAEEYTSFLSNKITEAVAEAWKNRKPAAISWGRGHAVIGFNRRISYFDGSSVMYGKTDQDDFSHIEGSEDHAVDLLFTYDTEGRLSGMIVNVPCPSQCSESAWFVSSDFWHETRQEIKKRHGEHLFILPQCSAAGDLSPRTMINRSADARMLKLKGYGEEYNMARRQDIADKLAAVVDEVLPLAAKDVRWDIPFAHRVSGIDLPLRHVTDEELDHAKRQVAIYIERLAELESQERSSADYSSAFKHRDFNQSVIDMYERQQKGKQYWRVELHTLRIGDVALCSNRFEYFLDYGMRIKARSKAIQTFVIQLAGNGTYLPTERAMRGGGYGAYVASTPVAPEGGQMIVEEHIKIIDDFFSKGA